jgi:hypothetical protein
VPGLHVHLVPCLWWHLCSISPHGFVLKNTSLRLSADFMGQGVRISSITACFRFLPAVASSFPCMTSLSAHCAFFKIALLSSSFLLIAIHVCIPALVWPNTGRPKMWAAALVVQQPLKVLSQNLQTAILAPPFLASDEFETVKYCQI